jgi:hypothetical protein
MRRIIALIILVSAATIAPGASGRATSPTSTELLAPTDTSIELGSRSLGERCSKDCQCESLECKGFKCVVRDYSKHPILDSGSACSFDGDCRSCDCAAFKCK